ncbi:hypothetical protein CQW23_24471 [Capsicum baccatum]|uniref:Uncharacterized protein n=1 Tax=Capsicum baccatum TaxID=33114 RepID=A0A2G2VUY0_CAPBA|nr:hypothetical protein CQW23_24471 [Capsicum baccatum]
MFNFAPGADGGGIIAPVAPSSSIPSLSLLRSYWTRWVQQLFVSQIFILGIWIPYLMIDILHIHLRVGLSLKSSIDLLIDTFNSANNPVNDMTSARAEAMILYSASAKLLDTVCCFLNFQDIKDSPKFTTYPMTDLLVFRHATQSESYQHTRSAVG